MLWRLGQVHLCNGYGVPEEGLHCIPFSGKVSHAGGKVAHSRSLGPIKAPLCSPKGASRNNRNYEATDRLIGRMV